MSEKIKTLDLELNDAETWALAQFCKRITYQSVKDHAIDVSETEIMMSAISKLQDVLIRHGFNPR